MVIYRWVVLMIFIACLTGCVSSSEIHTFASNSVQALQKVNGSGYSFSDYCRQDCELQQMRRGIIVDSFACNCVQPAASADSAIQKIHFTITAYLDALEQLSNNKGFNYDVSGLAEAIQKSSLLQLSSQQVSIATRAGNFISTAATTFYRSNKLKQYIGDADPIFQDLTETFVYLVDNRVRAQLKFEYEAHLPNIRQMMDNTTERSLRQFLVKLYLDEKTAYLKHNASLDSYVRVLQLVQKGHHELYLQRNNLKDTKTKDLIKRYSKDLQYIFLTLK